jgi:hypothetical protein
MVSKYFLLNYFARLETAKVILWCYLIWYLITVYHYYDASLTIWLNSLGISAVIGFALLLSVSGSDIKAADRWQTFRLFLMPFCVSSFSSLIKGHGFILIAPPTVSELVTTVCSCIVFVFFVAVLKRISRNNQS